jgi:hypothetical protein
LKLPKRSYKIFSPYEIKLIEIEVEGFAFEIWNWGIIITIWFDCNVLK